MEIANLPGPSAAKSATTGALSARNQPVTLLTAIDGKTVDQVAIGRSGFFNDLERDPCQSSDPAAAVVAALSGPINRKPNRLT